MTRDEAIEKLRTAQPRIDTVGNADLWISAFEALGMLKLDEPKSRISVFCEEMGWPEGGMSYQAIFGALDKAGLKIVEK